MSRRRGATLTKALLTVGCLLAAPLAQAISVGNLTFSLPAEADFASKRVVNNNKSARLYRIGLQAPDTLAMDSFMRNPPQVAAKQLIADLSTVQRGRLDNMEAMSWGPPLPDGTRVLVFASDDNFNPAQANQILVTAYRPSTPCAP